MSEEAVQNTDQRIMKTRMLCGVLYLLLLPFALPFFVSALLAYGTTEEVGVLDVVVFCASIALPLLMFFGAIIGVWSARGVRSPRKHVVGRVALLLPLLAFLLSLLMYV